VPRGAIARWAKAGLLVRTDWKGRPLIQTPCPAKRVKGAYFDDDAVVRVLKFFALLTHLIGRWAGVEFRLLDWQVEYLVAPVFGWKHPDGRRIIRTVWFEIPRKNGKSTLCSGLALYLLCADREAAAEVYAAAGDKDQARIVFGAAKRMAEGAPAIAKRLRPLKNVIEYPKTGSVFRVLSSDGDRHHGLNVHGSVIDEVHVHKNPDTIDAIETGVGSREQPLVVFITTADDGDEHSIYATKRDYVENCAAGTVKDATFYGVVFGVDDQAAGFDPFSREALAAANPGAGVTVLWDYLEAKANEARQSPKQLNRYLRLHLNVRTKQTVRFLPMHQWDHGAQLIAAKEWKRTTAWGGLDLSSTTDLTAFALIADTGTDWIIRPMFWLPEERAEELERSTKIPFTLWRRNGFLRFTEGSVIDYAAVRADITREIDELGVDLEGIGYDPWNATETVHRLEDEGFNMVVVRQGYASLSAPTKFLERLVLGSTAARPLLRHGGHPVLRWNADVVQVRTDDNGNVRPVKPERDQAAKRIDGIVAVINALHVAGAAVEEQEIEVNAW
jgi:phage terminase large subunit-like protein